MALNSVKGLMGILFPLIAFPYSSKVLGVDAIGAYNFANSVISYLMLIAGLGVSTYAIREGAKYRDNESKFCKFANEIFSINILSTVLSYIIFSILFFNISKLEKYRLLLIILSFQIIFKTLGVDWIYAIYEDFLYITVRSILFQISALIALFIFVHTPKDIYTYCGITVVSSVGANILNFFHVRKYCKVHFITDMMLKKHLKPIIILFAMSVTVTVYVSSDITVLGFLKDNYTVGIYAVSSKIYTILKTLLSSVLVVSIPRLSLFWGKGKFKEFCVTAERIYKTLLTFILPTVVGLFILDEQIILIVSNETFIDAVSSLRLLGVAMIFCMCAYFWAQCILVPIGKEKIVFKATLISAIFNVVFNLILIPFGAERAAALTTIIAEGIVFFWCMHYGKREIKLHSMFKIQVKIMVGCILIVIISGWLQSLSLGLIPYVTLVIICSLFIYFLSQIVLKNEIVYEMFREVNKKKLRK